MSVSAPEQLALDEQTNDHEADDLRSSAPPAQVVIGGRILQPSPVFETYWRFAARRQQVYAARVAGRRGPWTSDPVLGAHRFTNCYRAADRVSQYAIREVAYKGDQRAAELIFRILLFKVFNKIETWRLLTAELGTPTLSTFDLRRYDEVLDSAFARGQRLYSAA
jgi:hypothetical protein